MSSVRSRSRLNPSGSVPSSGAPLRRLAPTAVAVGPPSSAVPGGQLPSLFGWEPVFLTLMVLFLIQSVSSFIIICYAYGVADTGAPTALFSLGCFLTPSLLGAFGHRHAPVWLLNVFVTGTILARSLLPFFTIEKQLLLASLASACAFSFLICWYSADIEGRFHRPPLGTSLTLAILLIVAMTAAGMLSDSPLYLCQLFSMVGVH